MTAREIREQILETVSRNGGHLASSLGAVEIAMALCEVFRPETDRVVWDVGHQAYAWKILTGRADRFSTLRRAGGLSGFPNPAESPCDAAVSGHAGSALSVAVGLAAARDRRGGDEHVVAVVGDASMANGVSFEALNHCAGATRRLIVVLNDNDMAISKPAGSLARIFGRWTSGVRYNSVKNATKRALQAARLGWLYGLGHRLKGRVKSLFVGNVFFEQLGFHYMGPIDGHDLGALRDALTVAKGERRPVLIHAVTRKGRGFAPAEREPTRWHGVGPFAYPPTAQSTLEAAPRANRTWSDAFGAAVSELARSDGRVVALTAAMTDGTGLEPFAAEFPGRFFDVGIAEEHMVSCAAGLAAGGMRPVVAVYSTFLQRAVDQILHDVCLANLPVVFCIDRAGVVGADGATHQGLYDLALLRTIPGLTICQPKDEEDLKLLLREALERGGPTAIRYPRGRVVPATSSRPAASPRLALWTTGDWYARACAVAERLGDCEVVHARSLKPFDADLLRRQRAQGLRIVSLENGTVVGGLGEAIGADLRLGWPDEFVPHGEVGELERRYGLDADSLCERIVRWRKETERQV